MVHEVHGESCQLSLSVLASYSTHGQSWLLMVTHGLLVVRNHVSETSMSYRNHGESLLIIVYHGYS